MIATSTAPHRDAAGQPAAWCLRFLSGALRGRTIALRPGANVLGSGGDCEVMLPGGDVLPRHLAFTVGELAVSVQRLGAAGAQLNGEELPVQRRSVMAGDVISVGTIDFQLDHNQPVAAEPEYADSMFAGIEMASAAAPQLRTPAPTRRARGRWLGGGVVLLTLAGLLGVASWDAAGRRRPESDAPRMHDVEKLLAGFPEVEAVAGPGGALTLRGFVESHARKLALREALQPLGPRVELSVLSADEMIEQARRFISDPGVAITYAGHGRLVVSGISEEEGLRSQIRRLGEDLHPAVLVSDKVQYRARQVRDDGAHAREQWAAWQNVLPARMVGITEDGNGLRYIQLANGGRYYEGSVLRSGAELERIDADGLVIRGGPTGNAKDKQ